LSPKLVTLLAAMTCACILQVCQTYLGNLLRAKTNCSMAIAIV